MAGSGTLVDGVSVTRRLVTLAGGRGGVLAFIGPGRDGLISWSYDQLVATIEAAAAGLAWYGLEPRDVVGVQVADTTSFVLASHAIRAAGGIPTPVAPGLTVCEVAGQLAESDARMLITVPELAKAAVAAADRSWVRQVFSFGEAAGTTPFESLLTLGALEPARIRPYDQALLPFCRTPEGRLRPAPVTHADLDARLGQLASQWRLVPADVVLVGSPAGDGLEFTVGLDGALLSGATVVAARSADLAAAAAAQDATAAIVPSGGRARFPAEIRVLEVA